MRWIPLFLVLSLALLTAFSTPAAAPGPMAGQHEAPVTTLTDQPAPAAPALNPGRHNVRMKAVTTTYARPRRQEMDLKPVSQFRMELRTVAQVQPEPSRQSEARIGLSRAPLSLQQTPPDNTRAASLAAKRLLSLAQRDLTSPRGPILLLV